MRTLSFIAIFLAFTFFANAQDVTSDKTLVKTLDPEEATSVIVDFDVDKINPQVWDGQGFRLEIVIEANMPIQVLEQLVKVGRYNLEGHKEGDKYVVSAPNMGKSVSVRGKDLEEKITVELKTPGFYVLTDNKLSKNDEVIAGRDLDADAVKNFYKIKDEIKISKANIKSTLKSDVKLELKTGDIVIDGQALEIE